jgi:hypothetical protein
VLGNLKTISFTHDDVAVEQGIFVSPAGVEDPPSPRICHRERVMRKM